jgi:hypothetical protein
MHPDLDPDVITESMHIQPEWSWRAGEPRVTPKGTKLEGVRTETYWTSTLHKEKSLRSGKTSIEDFLANKVQSLQESRAFLKTLRETGGHAEFFLDLFSRKNIGLELPSSLLGSMAELGIGLSLDIYAYPKKEPHNPAMQRIVAKVRHSR